MQPMLGQAREQQFAVPQPDFINLDMAASYLRTAARLSSPIILGFGENTLQSCGMADLKHLVRVIEALASRYEIPVALHLDHGSSFDICAKAVHAGFTSVMIDGSHLSFEENVQLTKKVVEIAHQSDVSVEGELGRLNSGAGYDLAHSDIQVLTDPEQARIFAEETGVDALAVSIGTVHGEYTAAPNIRIDLLEQISRSVPVPLVLHGASGTPRETLRECVRNGICKVNIYTDLVSAVHAAIRSHYESSTDARFTDVVHDAQQALDQTLAQYIEVLGSKHRA